MNWATAKQFKIVRCHKLTRERLVLATVASESEAEKIKNRYAAILTPEEVQQGYFISKEPFSVAC